MRRVPRFHLFLALLSAACAKATPPTVPDARPRSARFEMGWDPATGRGKVIERRANGDSLAICFHCGFPGYTGGLVIGNYGAPGMGFYPRVPIRGYSEINVFCAQDESIWDLADEAEYTYGWSENFGDGRDGKRLAYVAGRVLASDEHEVVLSSTNAGGCYEVHKTAYTKEDWNAWIIATQVRNRCAHPVRFNFFSGDDPWLGHYASSDGDVGYTPDGILRRERSFVAGDFVAGGLYDLGNSELGQNEAGFSNQANYFALDPGLRLPDFAAFANRFAHTPDEVDRNRPLDNKTMTALNLGWRNLALAPGESFHTAMALGLAVTGIPGDIPRIPALGDDAWSHWRRHQPIHPPAFEPRFAAERVILDVDETSLRVDADYVIANTSPASVGIRIDYPILVAADRPAPQAVLVDGNRVPVATDRPGRVRAEFPLSLPEQSIRTFHIRYRQRLRGHQATYLVTSARSWRHPIDRAVFEIRYPARFRGVTLSYPVLDRRTQNGVTTLIATLQPFEPDREMVLRWAPSPRRKLRR
jgi:hypothetical protein